MDPAAKSGVEIGEDEEVTAVPEVGPSRTQMEKAKKARDKAIVVVKHIDIIKDDFWKSRPWILSGKPGKPLVADDQ